MSAEVIPMDSREPRVSIVPVTPEVAERWLGKNTSNRTIRAAKVRAYARDMRAGKWLLNGESIKFAEDGRLLDGQHRLLGVIESGATVQMLVVRGVSARAMQTIDTGAPRRFSDVLRINGDSNTHALAAIVRRAVMWEEGQRTNVGGIQPTHSEMSEFIDLYPEIENSAELGRRLASRTLLPASVIGLAHWLFSAIDADQATWFLARVVDEEVPANHPARTLHRRITTMRIDGGRVNESEALALTIRAWNAFRAGETPRKFQMPRGGLTNANFPEPR